MTQLNIKRIDEKAVMPTVSSDGNSFELTCTNLATGQGRDGRLVLEYRTGLEIDIPEGHVGMLFLADNGFVNSLVLTNAVATFTSASPKHMVARFKTNTDSVPVIYEVGEVFAKMIILELPKIEITELPAEIAEVKQEVIEEENVQESIA
jgi:dUTPase